MNAKAVAIATPLSWLKGEIDRSLALARGALARTVGAPAAQRTQALDACVRPVRHIRGALEMLRLAGAERFCSAVEQAIGRFVADPVRLNELSASVVDRALFALSQFLDDLAKGEPDVPLKLFPVYRELAECCERAAVTEVELFFPDVAAVPARARCPEQLDAEQRDRHVASSRVRFQRGLAAWLRMPRDVAALHAMREALDELDRIADQLDAPVGLWWVAAGLVDLLLHPEAQVDRTALKALLVRTERLLRTLGAGEQSAACALMREMLYPIALAAPVCARVCDIKSVYRLDAQLPEFCVSGTLEYDLGALTPVLDQMRQKLVAMEESWARYTDGSGEDLKRLRSQAAALKAIARDLGHYRLVRLLDIVSLIAARLPEAYPADNDVLALEMAAALLFMEGMLDHFTSPPADIDQQVAVMVGWLLDAVKPRGLPALGTGAPRDDITQRQHYTEVRAQVAREILANLKRIEQALEDLARDADPGSRIAALDTPMRQIAGALKMLGLSRANGVLSACLHLMTLSAADDRSLRRASLEWVADGLSCLGFYLENVCHGETPNEEILLGFVQRLSRDDAHAAGSTGWIPAARPEADGVHAPGTDPGASHANDEAQDESAASDLQAVYLEEARGILAEIGQWSGQLRTHPDDAPALIAVRRGFHTLKGSARVVGLDPEAELAWEVEQTLNWLLHTGAPASDEVLVLIDEAVEDFAAMVAMRAGGLAPEAGLYAKVAELAAALREAEASDPSVSACPQQGADAAACVDEEHGAHAAADSTNDAAAATPPCSESDLAAEASESDDAHATIAASGEAQANAAPLEVPDIAALAPDIAVAAPGAAAEDEEVAIGAVRLSATLYRIYRDESERLLATVQNELARLACEPPSPPPAALFRAAHTLRSTSSTLGFAPVSALAGAFEEALQRLDPRPIPAHGLAALDGAARALGAMLAAIRAQRAPDRDTRAEAALHDIGASPAADHLDAAAMRAGPIGQPDARLTAIVLDESGELMDCIAAELARWRQHPDATEPPRAMARALHTLKGSVRMVGAARTGTLVHALESRIGMAIESGQADQALFDEVAGALDRIAQSIDALATALHPEPGGSHHPAPPQPPIGVGADTLDTLVEQAGEISIVRLGIEAGLEGWRQSAHDLTDAVARLRTLLRETQVEADSQMESRSARPPRSEPGFDSLELDRYTRLQELTRMMAESLHDVQMIQQTLVANAAETDAALALQGRIARAVQQQLIELRSQPFGALRERLERTVSQTAQALGRHAELALEGSEIELDCSLLRRLVAPLEHIIRNALAHGIEEPAVRAQLGKPPAGRIQLRLELQGLGLEITLADDGTGLDHERIANAAIGLGLLRAGENPPEAALNELIFAPGLSTADALTENAGRGIGLDAARTEIAALGGRIEVTTSPGAGTVFRIRLPLSPASAQVLLIRAGGNTYAIPSNLVEGVEELTPAALEEAYAEGMVRAAYPLYRLPHLLGADARAAGIGRRNAVVLVASGEQRVALHVDEVLRSQECVLKPLGPQLARVPGLAGITVIGNNQPVLVIDPLVWSGQARLAHVHPRLASAANEALEPGPPHVMVVDDSLTVRRLTARLLSRAGYEVSAAKDGADALQQMQRGLPDLFVIDLEMPRMDGFELARTLRADGRTAQVPIVVVTSRLAEKHQRRAAEMGADAFFGKPYAEDELLACITGLLGRRQAAQAAQAA